MPWTWRPYNSRYDPRYDPYYYGRRPQGSCLRDACLLETGCCVAEALDGNCLMLALPLLPQIIALSAGGLVRGRAERARALVGAIRIYQRDISAHRPSVCRFTPSCSEYAAQAIERHGAGHGLVLAARRLLRCRPGGSRGMDPVPA
jgi:putative membrane protein insertion efficiency factor